MLTPRPVSARDEALARLRDYHELSMIDPETAHALADSVLLELINDAEIRSAYRYATRHDVLSELAMFAPIDIPEGDPKID